MIFRDKKRTRAGFCDSCFMTALLFVFVGVFIGSGDYLCDKLGYTAGNIVFCIIWGIIAAVAIFIWWLNTTCDK